MCTRRRKKTALEVIFTVLHAGGKFETGNYKTAGGLHGVGASVVNALSRELVATVKRDGHQWEMRFKQGKPVGTAQEARRRARHRHDGLLPSRPDRSFRRSSSMPAVIRERLEVASYLHRGVKVTFDDETTGTRRPPFSTTTGSSTTSRRSSRERGAKPVHEAPFVLQKENGVKAELVLQWTEATDEHLRSYVNGIPTGSGGTHENGLRAGLGKAVRNYIETHNLTPKGVTLTAEDIREGLTGVLSVFLQEPQFQGQTKDRLNNPEMLSAVDGMVRPALEHWLNTTSRSPKRSWRASSWRRARARRAARRSRKSSARARRPGASRCRASSPTARIPAPSPASSSSSKAIPPAGRRSRDAIARARRSCRSAAR